MGWIVWIIESALCLVASYAAAVAVYPDRSVLDRFILAMVVDTGLILLAIHLCGFVHQLYPAPLAVVATLLSGAVLYASHRATKPGVFAGCLRSDLGAPARLVADTIREREVSVATIVPAALAFGTCAVMVWYYRSWTWDPVWYHVPKTSLVIQEHSLRWLEIPNIWTQGNPANLELLAVWNCIFPRDNRFDDSAQLPWLRDRGIALVRGRGVITGVREVTVGDDVLTAERAVVLGTGTTPAMPPIPGLEEAAAWSNREITTAEAVPARLIVIGGGPIGVEMAGAWRSLGSEVTLLENAPRILGREEEFASAQVADGLRAHGIVVHEGVRIERVDRDGPHGEVTVRVADVGTRRADELVVAAGRRPQTDGIGVELVGGEPGRPLEVDDTLRVPGHEWLFVVGDANGRALLTHMGKHQARLAADVICGADVRLRASADPPPRVTFSDPQVAAVGHTLASARKAGLNVRAVDAGTSANAGGSFYGRDVPGTSRLVVDEDRRVLVGATFVGADVQDFLHAATIAVVAGVSLDDLWHAIPAFPTRSEVWLNLLQEYGL